MLVSEPETMVSVTETQLILRKLQNGTKLGIKKEADPHRPLQT